MRLLVLLAAVLLVPALSAQRTGGTLVFVVGQPTDSNPQGQTDTITIDILSNGSVGSHSVTAHVPRRTTPNNKAHIIETAINNQLNGGPGGARVNVTRNNNVLTVSGANGDSIAASGTNNSSRQRGQKRKIHKPPPCGDPHGSNASGGSAPPPFGGGITVIPGIVEPTGVGAMTMFASGPWPIQLGVFGVEFGVEGQDGMPPKVVTVDPAAYAGVTHMLVDIAQRLQLLGVTGVQLVNPWQLRFVLTDDYDTLVVGNWQLMNSAALSTIEQLHLIESN